MHKLASIIESGVMTPEVGLDRQMFWDSEPLLTSFNTIKVSSSVKHVMNAMGEDEPPLTITWAVLMNSEALSLSSSHIAGLKT